MDMQPPVQAALISAGISAVVAISISLFAERIRRWLVRPKLEIVYGHKIGGCRVDNTGERIYIRVKIINQSRHPAINCRAYLVKLQLLKNDREILFDCPTLDWPYLGHKGIDIVNTVGQFVNIAYSVNVPGKDNQERIKFHTSFLTSEMRNIEKEPESCRLGIALIADHGYRKDFSIDLMWGGQWDTLHARIPD